MMSSTKSLLSATSDSHEDIVRMCYLKKMKTMKKKFFVLRREGPKLPARLEYYDSEKKFKSGLNPKRSIELKKCFNINKRQDTRVKHCLALYTKDDCFCVVLDSADDANDWLKSLLELQHGGATEPGEIPKPTFEFVWEVKVQEKGLGATYNILGSYRVCLTTKSLSLIKMGCKDEGEEQRHTYEFSLASIRRCGARQCFFYMEVGRSSVTGAGELWMVTDDQHIATHMHNAILYAMSGGSKTATSTAAGTTPPSSSAITTMAGTSDSPLDTDMEPKQRHRSSSNIETTKPLVIQRRQTHGNDTMLGFLSGVQAAIAAASSTTCASVSGPLSCSSTTSVLTTTSLLSCSTAPSSASTEHPLGLGVSGSVGGALGGSSSSSRERCDSLPCAPRTRTTSEGYCPPSSAPHHPRVLSGLSHAHHLQGSAHNFLSPSARPHSMHYGSRGISYSPPIDCSPVSPVSGGCSTEDSAGSSLSIDETDGGSLPWSESALHHHQITRSLTESLGGSTPPSRYSGMLDNGRYGGGQLLSPDDSIPGSILEENSSDYIPWGSHISEEDQEYMQMDRQSASNLTLPLTTTASTTINNNKYPSNKSGSPSQSSYMEMSSPLGSSPRDVSGYIMMSPGADVTPQASTAPPFPRSSGLYISGAASANHSRGSSLAEDTPLGYVAMTPSSQASQAGSHKDDGYVDMAPDHSRGGSLGGSSCSLTSGTPSMTNTGDHSNHFSSEFHLEKVSSYFTPSEDEEDLGSGASGSLPRHLLQEGSQVRPARAYSLGSRPESLLRRHRLDVIQQDVVGYHMPQAARARALSMGAQQKPVTRSPLQQPRHHSPISIKGSSRIRTSAPTGPFLSSSWSGSSTASSSAVPQKIPRAFQGTRDNPHTSLEPISTDDNLMELDFSAAKKISSANSDYLEMDLSSSEKVPTSPIFEEYVDMRKQSKPINLPKKSSNILPLFSSSRTEDRVSPNRGSPSQGSPSRGNSEDYLNMQCGNGRRSQPINIANTQPAANSSNKSSTSPNLFSLPGFFSRKNSSGTGTPPKVPERSNSPSPFSSLRRRGKKNSKKNKDKRNSMSSDDTSNVTTPVGMFPFSPSTPSKSFVPEEQFAKCSIDASSGGVRLTAEETTEDPYVSTQPTELAKRKVSTALRPPILGQSGGKTVVIGQDSLQAPTPTRARSSSSESEYVPMHPSRRKFSDAPGYSESSVLDKSRKCASDNILDSTKSDYALTLNERLSRKDAMDDYAMLAPGASTVEMKPKVIQAGKPAEKPSSDAYSMMQPGATTLKSTQPSGDYAMMPGIASTPPKIPEQPPANDEYLMMSFSRTPPKSSMLDSRTVLETLTEHVATTNQDGDYAMLSPRTKIEKFSSTSPVTSRLSSTPPVTGRLSSTPPSKFTPPSSSKLSSTPPKLSSTPPTRESPLERKLSQPPSHLEDYALMIPGDGRSSPKLIENHRKLDSENSVSQTLPPSSGNSDYALMKPGENIIEYESSFKCVQPIEPDSGEYALLAQNQAASSLISRLSEDYALMLPGKVSDDKATNEKENNTETRSLLRPSETRKSPSPSRDSSDDYVLMTPAIKPSLLPTDAPISLHLNKPTSPHIPVVVMPTKAPIRTEDTKSSPLVSTNNVVPDNSILTTSTTTTSTSIVPNSSTIVVPVTSITAIVPSSIAIIPSVTKSNPIATKSSSIPLASSKPTQSTPIHIPKTKTTQSSCSKPITSTKISASSLPKPIPSKPIPMSTTRQVSKQQQNKPGNNNKNNLSSTAATKSSNNKPMGQKSKCMNRRSASKSPLPPQPELNYASLDLPQCQDTSTAVDDGSGAPALARNLSSDSSGESDVTSIGTTYAQIDFVRTQQQQAQQQQQQQQQQPQQQTSKKNNAKQERKS